MGRRAELDAASLAWLVAIVAVVVLVGALAIRVGMLLAPKIERWDAPPEPDDEGGRADDQR